MDYGAAMSYEADRAQWRRDFLEQLEDSRIRQHLYLQEAAVGDLDEEECFAALPNLNPIVQQVLAANPRLLEWRGAEAAAEEMGMSSANTNVYEDEDCSLEDFALMLLCFRLRQRLKIPSLHMAGSLAILMGVPRKDEDYRDAFRNWEENR